MKYRKSREREREREPTIIRKTMQKVLAGISHIGILPELDPSPSSYLL